MVSHTDDTQTDTTSDSVHQVVAFLHRDQVSLDLKTVDICFLVALHSRADRSGLTCFDEDVLLDVFEQICDAVESDSENISRKATSAIQRLRDQRLLARVDGAGVVRAGEYALTQLALGIVRFFVADEALTRETLTLLTKTLVANLAEVKAAARKASTPDEWRQDIVAPLRVTIGDLIAGIERRQRGLDLQQEGVQQQIGALLQADWFGAVDQCQALLDETSRTLAELNTVLLRDTNQILALLADIEQLAATASMADSEDAVRRVSEQVDRVAAWGASRQRAWSEYYQYVHRFLRDVVRLDPDRAISERLRNQLASWPGRRFYLITARAPAIRLLRDRSSRAVRPPVSRPRCNREENIEEVQPEIDMITLADRVRAALSNGHLTLTDVLNDVLPDISLPNRYVSVGRVALQVANETNAQSPRERDWTTVLDNIDVEEWKLSDYE